MTPYTIIGAAGLVGSALAKVLKAEGVACNSVNRRDPLPEELGHVVYCAGRQGSQARGQPFETMTAHVMGLEAFFRSPRFESFTYLSSTRVYLGLDPDLVAREDARPLLIDPLDPANLFNLSKLAGESICLTQSDERVRVVRLSNVYSGHDNSGNFLTAVLRNILTTGTATLTISPSSAKDYIDLDDVAQALAMIPRKCKSRVINLAGGRNIPNAEIMGLVQRETGYSINVISDAPEVRFPPIAIDRLVEETGLKPMDLGDRFSQLVAQMSAHLRKAPETNPNTL